MPRAFALRLDMPDPADASALAGALAERRIAAGDVLAVLLKTPGNGLTNDFSRALATRSVQAALGDLVHPPLILASGGIEGIALAHMLVLGRTREPTPAGEPRLAIGLGRGAPLAAGDIGTVAMADAVAGTVASALAEAGLAPAQARLAIVKAPIPTPAALGGDHAALKAQARAAAALGVMLALGELPRGQLASVALGGDAAVFSTRALVAAGTDVAGPEALVLGMARAWGGDLVVASGIMRDMLDIQGLRAVLEEGGVTRGRRLVSLLAKGAMPDLLAGARPAAHDDSDIHPNRHWRAAMSGIVAAVAGDLRPFLSGGGEHQGPPGGVTVAVLAEQERAEGDQGHGHSGAEAAVRS